MGLIAVPGDTLQEATPGPGSPSCPLADEVLIANRVLALFAENVVIARKNRFK